MCAYTSCVGKINEALEVLSNIRAGDRVYETRKETLYTSPKGVGLYHLVYGEGREATLTRVEKVVNRVKQSPRDFDKDLLLRAAAGIRLLKESFGQGKNVAETLGRIFVAADTLEQCASTTPAQLPPLSAPTEHRFLCYGEKCVSSFSAPYVCEDSLQPYQSTMDRHDTGTDTSRPKKTRRGTMRQKACAT